MFHVVQDCQNHAETYSFAANHIVDVLEPFRFEEHWPERKNKFNDGFTCAFLILKPKCNPRIEGRWDQWLWKHHRPFQKMPFGLKVEFGKWWGNILKPFNSVLTQTQVWYSADMVARFQADQDQSTSAYQFAANILRAYELDWTTAFCTEPCHGIMYAITDVERSCQSKIALAFLQFDKCLSQLFRPQTSLLHDLVIQIVVC